MVYNPREVERKGADWISALPWIRPYYAVKSNPHHEIVRDVFKFGGGADCASRSEIKQALETGFKPKDIVYSNSVKEEKDLAFAKKNKI